MILDINMCLTVRTLNIVALEALLMNFFGRIVTFSNQSNERMSHCICLFVSLFASNSFKSVAG